MTKINIYDYTHIDSIIGFRDTLLRDCISTGKPEAVYITEAFFKVVIKHRGIDTRMINGRKVLLDGVELLVNENGDKDNNA